MDKQYQIPSSIASKLEQIKLYMGTHSVTAFVGAGFSMNAEIPNNVSMKTWAQLREVFLDKLYPNNEEDKKNEDNDVVRLSSLVDAQFGHNELDNILEEALPDQLIQPGRLHRLLVQLPWKDILTTNYDTLVERAAGQVINGFKLVTNKETLLYQPSPRIIKLHGSFPNIRPYIMTQEDYRRYPIERPEMVNTAKQCFLESLVCLIGFSGEDPNFRAWIGWLKDVIGQQRICPTYLITYRKGFHDAEKALLSKLGIDIINLADVEGVDGYYSAYEFFLNYLKERPSKWNGTVRFDHLRTKDLDDDQFKTYITEQILKMRAIREAYPGWLLLPRIHEKDFERLNEDIAFMDSDFNRITDDKTKLQFLYETNWRLTISATPKKIGWFIDTISAFVEHLDDKPNENKKMLQPLIISLLEILRYDGENDKFLQLCDKLLKNDSQIIPSRHLCYQLTLYWLVRYDKNKVKECLSKWLVDISDYQNCLQKANILYFVGEDLEAYQLLAKCKNAICKSLLQNKDDLYAKSCLTYILKTMSWCDKDSKGGKEDDIEADNITKFAEGEAFDELTERLSGKAYETEPTLGFVREHLFEIGNYTNSWKMGPAGFVHNFLYPCKWWMLKERLGMPMFSINQNFTKYCIRNMFEYSWNMAWNMMILSANSKIVEDVLGRKQLSTLSEDSANEYFDTYIALFENTDIRENNWVCHKVMNLLPTILGRLCTKVSQDRVLRFVKAALKWAPQFVDKVLKYAYDCLDNTNLTVIWSLMMSEKDLATHYRRGGYPFPERYMLKFVITDAIKKRIVDGLKSDKKEDVLQSVFFMEVIWEREELTEADRNKIVNAVREMRNGGNAISEAIHTYSYIEMNDEERESVLNKLNEEVRTFCETTYQFNHSSEPFSQWNSALDHINILRRYISEEQKKNVLLHCCDMIELNKESFERNDCQEFFGGLRQFTRQIIKTYQSLFIDVSLDGWTDEESTKISEQIDWLRSKEYRCLPMKVKIQMRNQLNLDNDIVGNIQSALFSKKEDLQVEGVKAFLVLKDKGGDVNEILNYVFENFALADSSAYKELLILFANLIIRDYEDNDFQQHTQDFLNRIHRDCDSYGLDADALSDLQHYANYVSGALSIKNPNMNPTKFSKEESGFNDVVVGFDKGVEVAQRKNV